MYHKMEGKKASLYPLLSYIKLKLLNFKNVKSKIIFMIPGMRCVMFLTFKIELKKLYRYLSNGMSSKNKNLRTLIKVELIKN